MSKLDAMLAHAKKRLKQRTKKPIPKHGSETLKTTCCGNPSQCWEPCGELGKSAEHAEKFEEAKT